MGPPDRERPVTAHRHPGQASEVTVGHRPVLGVHQRQQLLGEHAPPRGRTRVDVPQRLAVGHHDDGLGDAVLDEHRIEPPVDVPGLPLAVAAVDAVQQVHGREAPVRLGEVGRRQVDVERPLLSLQIGVDLVAEEPRAVADLERAVGGEGQERLVQGSDHGLGPPGHADERPVGVHDQGAVGVLEDLHLGVGQPQRVEALEQPGEPASASVEGVAVVEERRVEQGEVGVEVATRQRVGLGGESALHGGRQRGRCRRGVDAVLRHPQRRLGEQADRSRVYAATAGVVLHADREHVRAAVARDVCGNGVEALGEPLALLVRRELPERADLHAVEVGLVGVVDAADRGDEVLPARVGGQGERQPEPGEAVVAVEVRVPALARDLARLPVAVVEVGLGPGEVVTEGEAPLARQVEGERVVGLRAGTDGGEQAGEQQGEQACERAGAQAHWGTFRAGR
jgi:hypothetical protein